VFLAHSLFVTPARSPSILFDLFFWNLFSAFSVFFLFTFRYSSFSMLTDASHYLCVIVLFSLSPSFATYSYCAVYFHFTLFFLASFAFFSFFVSLSNVANKCSRRLIILNRWYNTSIWFVIFSMNSFLFADWFTIFEKGNLMMYWNAVSIPKMKIIWKSCLKTIFNEVMWNKCEGSYSKFAT